MTNGLLHTTESDPGTFAGNYFWFTVAHPEWAPHWLIDPSTKEKTRFVPNDQPSKALRNLPGGVETNNRPGGLIQVEIVGRAADVGNYPLEWYANLAQFLREISDEAGIAYVFDESTVRMTFEEWMSPWIGWTGHVRVPENDHWDPGTLRYDLLRLLETPMSDLNLNQIVFAHPGGDRTKPVEGYTLGAYLTFLLDCANQAENQTKAVAGIANGVQAVLTLLQNGAASQQGGAPVVIDYSKLAKAVADELAYRLTPR